MKQGLKFYNDYSLMMSEAKTKSKQKLKEQGLKYLHQRKCFKDYK